MTENKKREISIYVSLLTLVFIKSSIAYLLITSFPTIQIEFQINNFLLGLIVSIFYLVSLLFTFVWIYFIEKTSNFNVFFIGTIIWIGGCFLFSMSTNYVVLLLSAALIGVGIESITVATLIYIFNSASKRNQAKIFSIFLAIQGMGTLFGILITSVLNEIFLFSWNYVFIFTGTLSLIFCLLIYVYFKLGKIKILDPTQEINKESYIFQMRSFGDALKKKSNLGLFVLVLIVSSFLMVFNVWLQKYFQEVHGLSQLEASLSYIFLTGGEFLGMMIGGLILDKLYSPINYNKINFVCFSIMISVPIFLTGLLIPWNLSSNTDTGDLLEITLNLFTMAISDGVILVSYILLFLGFILYAPIYTFCYVMLNDCNSEHEKSAAIGTYNFGVILGQLGGPLIGGILGDVFSLTFVLVLPAFVLFFIGISFLLLKKSILHDFLENQRKDQSSDITFNL